MTKHNWPELTPSERDAIILPLWLDGQSASEIAALFTGATRNSVIGRITRSKAPKRSEKTRLYEKSKPKPKPAAKQDSEKPRKLKNPMSVVSLSAFVSHPDPEPVTESIMHMIENNRQPLAGVVPVGIMGLPIRPGGLCRFPVTGGYCGIECGDKMYCVDHHAIMYRPSEKLRMPKEARR